MKTTSISIEAVVCGALMRIEFEAGTTPAEAVEYIKAADANAKVREDFPSRGGFGGKRDTKAATALVINCRISSSGKFIDITAHSADGEDLAIAVSKRASEEWLGHIKALGKLSAANIAKLDKAFAEQGSAVVILSDAEKFAANYWKTDDGKAFLDSMTADIPAGNGAST